MNRIFTTIGLSVAALALVLVPGPAVASPPDPTGSPATTSATPEAGKEIKVSVTNPTSKTSPITFIVIGLADGQWVDIDGHPAGWTGEAPYHLERQQVGTDPFRITVQPPTDGWPKGTYEWTVTFQGGEYVQRTTTFAPTSTTTQRPNKTKSPKPSAGGLARTGV